MAGAGTTRWGGCLTSAVVEGSAMSSSVAGLRSAPSPWLATMLAALKRAATVVGQHARRPGLVIRFTIIGATMALLIATTLAGLIEARLSEYIMDLTVERAVDQ